MIRTRFNFIYFSKLRKSKGFRGMPQWSPDLIRAAQVIPILKLGMIGCGGNIALHAGIGEILIISATIERT